MTEHLRHSLSYDEALATLMGGLFYYTELRGAINFSRWVADAQAVTDSQLVPALQFFLAQQCADEWRHTALCAQWLEHKHLAAPKAPPCLVKLMDAQDSLTLWAERFCGTNLVLEGLALSMYPALMKVVDGSTRRILQSIYQDETSHVADGVKWAEMFLQREQGGKEAAKQSVAHLMRLNFETAEWVTPIFVALGADIGGLIDAIQRSVPQRLRRLGLDPTAVEDFIDAVPRPTTP